MDEEDFVEVLVKAVIVYVDAISSGSTYAFQLVEIWMFRTTYTMNLYLQQIENQKNRVIVRSHSALGSYTSLQLPFPNQLGLQIFPTLNMYRMWLKFKLLGAQFLEKTKVTLLEVRNFFPVSYTTWAFFIYQKCIKIFRCLIMGAFSISYNIVTIFQSTPLTK